ncbi:MAG: hypothetical protein ACOVQT_00605 [Rubrivivax sp.]|jgi:hypothetical protein
MPLMDRACRALAKTGAASAQAVAAKIGWMGCVGVLALAGCGGGEGVADTAPRAGGAALSGGEADVRRQPLQAPLQAKMQAQVADATAATAATTSTTVGAKELFDWAEVQFAPLFPKGPQNIDLTFEGARYTVRAYPNGNHLGLRADGRIFGLGPFTGNALTPFGALADYAALVLADRCTVYPGTCVGPRAWAGAALLENNNDFNIRYGNAGPLSAVDAQGNALVMWEQSDGTPDGSTRKVYTRRYVAGQGWQAAVTLPGVQVGSSAIVVDGRLLPDAAGNITWVDVNVVARRWSPATGWATSTIAAPGAGAGSLADAHIDAQGTVHVLRYGSGNVWYATLPAGATQWTAWVGLAGSNGAVSRDSLRLALAPAGASGAVAVWRERNPGDSNDSVWASRRVGSAWQPKVRIEELFTDALGQPVVGLDARGNAVAAWPQGTSLVVNRMDGASGLWGAAQEVDPRGLNAGFDARLGMVMHPDGRAVIAWNSGIFAVKTLSVPAAGALSAPVEAASYSIDRTLQMDGEGRVVMVHRSDPAWRTNPTGLFVQMQELPWGGSWTPMTRLDTGAGDVLSRMTFAMNPAGQGVVVWAQNDLRGNDARNSLWTNVRR